jgi:hypothetical protein
MLLDPIEKENIHPIENSRCHNGYSSENYNKN